MSVGDEQTECPLCMELLELDDINFFPCTCGYQICRFCWHRIRTDENGLCPACRKQYPEDPAEFRPLTEDELARIKKERRQKEVQRKQKAAENRKHLANVRVVQKNLVFVVGLSQRLAEVETLKKHEYFGKFGKIHKVVINQSTSYAGAQGPSASAYVTYNRPEDALRAIQAVNNIHVEGRTLKASLGTTKYCSHFLRGAQCPKPDCMYLHELGEEAASFTKEEMQQGKHQEYEQKLYEMCINAQNLTIPGSGSSSPGGSNSSSGSGSGSEKGTPPITSSLSESPPQPIQQPSQLTSNRKKTDSPTDLDGEEHMPPLLSGKEVWPVSNMKPERLTNGNKSSKCETHNGQNRAPGHHRSVHNHTDTTNSQNNDHMINGSPTSSLQQLSHSVSPPLSTQVYSSTQQIGLGHQTTQLHNSSQLVPHTQHSPLGGSTKRSPFENPVDSMSLFSSTNGFPSSRNPKPIQTSQPADSVPTATEIPDTIPVSSSTDWQAAFGFTPIDNCQTDDTKDDDLGFDPWDESAKALADMIEKESVSGPYHKPQSMPPLHHANHLVGADNSHHYTDQSRQKALPPGFNANHLGAFPTNTLGLSGSSGSKMLGLMQIPPSVGPNNFHLPPNNTYHDVLSDISLTGKADTLQASQNHDVFNTKDWQDGLRALLPNINISFGTPNHQASQMGPPISHTRAPPQHPHNSHLQKNCWSESNNAQDPAIVSSGNLADNSCVEEPPHWMASLQHLTEENHIHRMPFVHQFQLRGGSAGWGQAATSPTQPPPPGFHQSQLRHHPHQMAPEAQKLAEGLQ